MDSEVLNLTDDGKYDCYVKNNCWKIILYTTPFGDVPVQNFIDKLELKSQTKIYNTIELLKEFGILLGSPHVKKLSGTNLWELRILGSDSLRIFYIAISEKSFLFLHGFKKKQQKTPVREIKIALDRLNAYKIRKK